MIHAASGSTKDPGLTNIRTIVLTFSMHSRVRSAENALCSTAAPPPPPRTQKAVQSQTPSSGALFTRTPTPQFVETARMHPATLAWKHQVWQMPSFALWAPVLKRMGQLVAGYRALSRSPYSKDHRIFGHLVGFLFCLETPHNCTTHHTLCPNCTTNASRLSTDFKYQLAYSFNPNSNYDRNMFGHWGRQHEA